MLQRILYEIPRLTAACKAKAVEKDERYYYIFFLGTAAEGRGQGLCSALVRHYQDLATKEGASIYLEAATQSCRRLYQRLGFVTVDEIVLGGGRAAADGTSCVAGPGVTLWGMIWRPGQGTASS